MKHDLSVLILAPLGQDSALAAKVLQEINVSTEIMKDGDELCARLEQLAGCLLITEEAFTKNDLEQIYQSLSKQESWSDFPIILITSQKHHQDKPKLILDRFGAIGNVTLLERPFSTMTLKAVVQAAIRSREKQYLIRNLINKLSVEIKSKDEFMSIASHELKTPITSLKLQVQLKRRKLEKGQAEDSMDSFLSSIDKQINRLSRLVDDMLDITRIEHGKLSLNKTVWQLGEITSQIVRNLTPFAESAGFKIEFNISEDVTGTWDKFRIEQIITNLISNGVKYGEGPIVVNVSKQGHCAVLDVKDHGPGIPVENQDRIFKRYERASEEKNISGLGLGLYISRQIAEMHDGSLVVQSTPGQGSIFKLKLPESAE